MTVRRRRRHGHPRRFSDRVMDITGEILRVCPPVRKERGGERIADTPYHASRPIALSDGEHDGEEPVVHYCLPERLSGTAPAANLLSTTRARQ